MSAYTVQKGCVECKESAVFDDLSAKTDVLNLRSRVLVDLSTKKCP